MLLRTELIRVKYLTQTTKLITLTAVYGDNNKIKCLMACTQIATLLTDDRHAFLVDDAAGQQMEVEFCSVHNDRVASIVATL